MSKYIWAVIYFALSTFVLIELISCGGLVSNQVQLGDKNAKIKIPFGWSHTIIDEPVGRAAGTKATLTKSVGNQTSQIVVNAIKSTDAGFFFNTVELGYSPDKKIITSQLLLNKTGIDPKLVNLQSKNAGNGMLYYTVINDDATKTTSIYGVGESGGCFLILTCKYNDKTAKDVEFFISNLDLY